MAIVALVGVALSIGSQFGVPVLKIISSYIHEQLNSTTLYCTYECVVLCPKTVVTFHRFLQVTVAVSYHFALIGCRGIQPTINVFDLATLRHGGPP